MIRYLSSRFGESKLFFSLALILVLFAHFWLYQVLKGRITPPVLQIDTAQVDMSEGQQKQQEVVYFVNLEQLLPEPEKEPEQPVAVKASEEVKPDLNFKQQEKPKKKLEIKPKPKFKSKQKNKPEPKPVKPQEKEQTPVTGNSDTSNKAQGKANDGVSAQTSSGVSHLGGHLHNPKPPYPERSLNNYEEGVVVLRVVVQPDGFPSSVQIAKSSGYPRLDRSALNTVRSRYRFIPAMRNGTPVVSTYEFGIEFKIK